MYDYHQRCLLNVLDHEPPPSAPSFVCNLPGPIFWCGLAPVRVFKQSAYFGRQLSVTIAGFRSRSVAKWVCSIQPIGIRAFEPPSISKSTPKPSGLSFPFRSLLIPSRKKAEPGPGVGLQPRRAVTTRVLFRLVWSEIGWFRLVQIGSDWIYSIYQGNPPR